MGMSQPFEDDADFSALFEKLNKKTKIKITKIIQKTFISVNENGTEAAAASGKKKDTRKIV